MKKTLLCLALAATAVAAQAHQVWIEQDAQGAKLYFGEFGDNLRETSPGLLDKFPGPVASQGDAKPKVSKTPNGFAIDTKLSAGQSLIAEEPAYAAYDIKMGDKPGRGVYWPAARLVTDFSAQAPKLTLDLVPTGRSGDDGIEFQAFYNGKPLPKAKVAVVNVSGWSQERHTNENGIIRVPLPWQGTYVLELSHRAGAGERANGERFDRADHVTSLTVVQPQGVPSLPAPAAAKANK